jgi:4-amino-4-deoxy-L-arabinose transferase-like glycosyltransferase
MTHTQTQLPVARELGSAVGEVWRRASRRWGALAIASVIVLFALRACLVTAPLENLSRSATEPTDPAGTIAYEGSLYIARGGPVIVGFQSGGDARLVIDDGTATKELRGRGLVKDRILLPAGTAAIRFAAPANARLVWSPVGRRGDPEYVPASSLSPLSPDRAEFPAWAGSAPLDGVIASLLLLVIIASCLMLARHRLAAVPRATWISLGVVFAAGCILRWTDLGGFGQTWDEDVNWAAGRNYITNILSLDVGAGSWNWNYEHPPVMKYLAGIGAQFADGFGPARALSAIWMSLGCALLVPIGTRLYNHRVGVLAAVIATLLPHLVAHGQIVGHESPSVLWWTLGIVLALGVFDGEPTRKDLRLRLVAVGVMIGVAFGSRLVNGLLGVLCLAIVIQGVSTSRQRLRVFVEGSLIMPVTALVTFYVLWPRIWFSPLSALGTSGHKLGELHAPEPFLGVITNQPPRTYFMFYLLITIPVAILVGIVAWLARTASARERGGLVTALWFVIPLVVMFSPVRQDGVRYVMPCVVVMALMAAAGWDFIAGLAKQHAGRVFAGIACALVAYLSITLLRIRPYYLDYYGEQIGGPGEVARKSIADTAWWGEGLAEAVAYVNTHAAPGARVFRNCILPVHLAWFRADLWPSMTNQLRSAEWVVAYSPQTNRCPIPPELERAYVVEIQGAVLAIVYRTRQR